MRVCVKWQAKDYQQGLMLAAMRRVYGEVDIVSESQAQILLLGPFRKGSDDFKDIFRLKNRSAIRIFHTGENIRPDTVESDFQFTFDLVRNSESHFRLPFWWGSIDWSGWGVHGVSGARFGRLIKLEELCQGRAFDPARAMKCAFFTTHMRQPRRYLHEMVSSAVDVAGFGRAFDASVKNHNKSGLLKSEVLKDFMFSLCPENAMYPGYYTEKAVEAYAGGTIPLAWFDGNASVDFNMSALVNLNEYFVDWEGLSILLQDMARLREIYESPMLKVMPDFEGFLCRLSDISKSL